jgi:predicted RNase H-like HicB family nuclease
MSDLRYPAKVWQDAEGPDWIVKFRDLLGSNTGAPAEAEALAQGADCLGSYLAQLMGRP